MLPVGVDGFLIPCSVTGTFWVRAAADISAGGELLNAMMKLGFLRSGTSKRDADVYIHRFIYIYHISIGHSQIHIHYVSHKCNFRC